MRLKIGNHTEDIVKRANDVVIKCCGTRVKTLGERESEACGAGLNPGTGSPRAC